VEPPGGVGEKARGGERHPPPLPLPVHRALHEEEGGSRLSRARRGKVSSVSERCRAYLCPF